MLGSEIDATESDCWFTASHDFRAAAPFTMKSSAPVGEAQLSPASVFGIAFTTPDTWPVTTRVPPMPTQWNGLLPLDGEVVPEPTDSPHQPWTVPEADRLGDCVGTGVRCTQAPVVRWIVNVVECGWMWMAEVVCAVVERRPG